MTGPVELSEPQTQMLILVRWVGGKGHPAARKHPVLRALERRDLVAHHGTRAAPRVEAWHATLAGRKWVDDRAAAAKAMPDG